MQIFWGEILKNYAIGVERVFRVVGGGGMFVYLQVPSFVGYPQLLTLDVFNVRLISIYYDLLSGSCG